MQGCWWDAGGLQALPTMTSEAVASLASRRVPSLAVLCRLAAATPDRAQALLADVLNSGSAAQEVLQVNYATSDYCQCAEGLLLVKVTGQGGYVVALLLLLYMVSRV